MSKFGIEFLVVVFYLNGVTILLSEFYLHVPENVLTLILILVNSIGPYIVYSKYRKIE